ncbi:GumC family protein [Aliterella atlantica]|uniref:Capsular biosynthesis protein n=1 Tax=Aliterella atlantica CENA595 TaxID=1618023 RepID=A0A0D8ZYV0_9CYAN|nr:polysaccharide biosynthesis tyrosine autokinase [Aliterella atlantica]KJH73629.1 capsular biosynthesis protein [Aliterella atlantica CENA595]
MVRGIENNPNVANETEPGYGQLFAVLSRRRYWLLGVLGGVLTIATALTLTAEPTFQSTMQILIEANYQGRKDIQPGADSEFTDANVEIDYATQINVMRSTLLLQRAVDLLKPEYPDMTVKELKQTLVLTPLVEENSNTKYTKIVEANYVSNDPVKTQKVLQTIYQVYQSYNREQQEQRLKKGLKFINEQIPGVRNQVAQSEAQLEKFRTNQNLIDPEQQAAAINNSLNAVVQQRQVLRAQFQDTEARYRVLQQQVGSTPQVALSSSRLSQSPRYQSLLNELQRTDLLLAARRGTFTDADPGVQKLIELRQSQQALLQAEQARVVGANVAQANAAGDLLSQGQRGGLDLNITAQLAEVQTSLSALQAQDVSLAKTEQGLRSQLNRFPKLLEEYNRLLPIVQINREKLQQLLRAQQELSLEIARGGFEWQALEQPVLGLQVGPNIKQNLLLGLVAGLMLGGVAAFLREATDDAVHTSDELEKQVSIPLLGMTPEMPQTKASEPVVSLPFGKPNVLAPWTVQVSNWPPSWESLDLIYKNIQLLNTAVASLQSIMVTSAVAGEGKSTLALGLALSAARLHQRVLLIDADLRRPNLHQMLNLPNEEGLSTLLASDANVPSNAGIQSSGSYIDILTAGPMPADPANLLSSERMRELMAKFEDTYDLVLVDAPPVLGMVDAILSASFCSGVVLVSRMGKVTRTELTQATAMLSKLNMIGVVANQGHGVSHSYANYGKEQGVVLQQSWGQ